MATTIVCNKTDCIHNISKGQYNYCNCSVIGITDDGDCNSYWSISNNSVFMSLFKKQEIKK